MGWLKITDVSNFFHSSKNVKIWPANGIAQISSSSSAIIVRVLNKKISDVIEFENFKQLFGWIFANLT